MLQLVPGTAQDPALSLFRVGVGNVALTYSQLTKWLKKWVKLAGYDQQHFTSHSLRRGGPHGHLMLVSLHM